MKSRFSTTQNARKRAVIRRPMTKAATLRNSAPVCVVNQKLNTAKSSSRASQRSVVSPIKNETYLNNFELISLRNDLYDDPDFSEIDNEQLLKLQAHLREYMQDCGLREDYDEAEKASNLLEMIKNEINSRPNNFYTESEMAALEKERLKKFEDEWQDKFNEFDKTTETKTQELEKRQKKALDDFEEMWRTEKPQKYRKPSNRLLQIKQIEKSLAMTGQYERARLMHTEAEQLAAQEQKELQATLIRDYKEARGIFVKRQKSERQQFMESRIATRKAMESQKQVEYNKFINRNVVMQDKNKEAQKGNRERSGVVKPDYGTSVTYSIQTKNKCLENIIPPLFAPNDPDFLKEEEQRAREKRKKQLEFQKKNAEEALLDYTVQPSPREEEEKHETHKTDPNEEENDNNKGSDDDNHSYNDNKSDSHCGTDREKDNEKNENENDNDDHHSSHSSRSSSSSSSTMPKSCSKEEEPNIKELNEQTEGNTNEKAQENNDENEEEKPEEEKPKEEKPKEETPKEEEENKDKVVDDVPSGINIQDLVNDNFEKIVNQ